DLNEDSFKSITNQATFSSNQRVPYLLLNAVDRENPKITLNPYYIFPLNQDEQQRIFVLSLPFEDFLLLTQAAQGPKNMQLASIIRFLPIAEKYGFSYELYYQSLCNRGIRPFVYLILSILVAAIAWKFRLKEKTFVKFYWLLFIPFFTVVTYFIVNLSLYIMGILVYVIIGYNAQFALFIIATFLLFLILTASIIFVRSHKF
ncbi:MAG: hypothetical protein ACRC5H_06705, partial [Treponemataceae bacterium]